MSELTIDMDGWRESMARRAPEAAETVTMLLKLTPDERVEFLLYLHLENARYTRYAQDAAISAFNAAALS